jgi:hypothetical protein
MSWAGAMELLPRGLSLETQETFSALLVPFRNVISERRRLQNISGENCGDLKAEKVVKLKKMVFVTSGEFYIHDILRVGSSWQYTGTLKIFTNQHFNLLRF